MHSMSYDDVKNNVSSTLTNVQDQLNAEDYSKHSKEELESQLNVYQYVDHLTDMNYFYNNGY